MEEHGRPETFRTAVKNGTDVGDGGVARHGVFPVGPLQPFSKTDIFVCGLFLTRFLAHWTEFTAEFKQSACLVNPYLAEPFCFPDIKVALLFSLVLPDLAVLACLILLEFAFLFLVVNLVLFRLFLAMAWTSSRIVIPATMQSLIFQKAEIPPLYLAFTPPGPIPTPASILAEECVLENYFSYSYF